MKMQLLHVVVLLFFSYGFVRADNPTLSYGLRDHRDRSDCATSPSIIEVTSRPSAGLLSTLRPRLEHPNGWFYPAGSSNYQYLSWLCFNSGFNGYHLAQDMANPLGDPVYAIDYGTVIHSQCVGGYGGPSGATCGGVISIQHRAKDGTWFTAIYGHMDNYLPVGTVVYAGDIVGTSNNWNPPHVHFGVRLGVDPSPSNWFVGYTSSQSDSMGFTKPAASATACVAGSGFLETYFACKNGNSVAFRPNGSRPFHPNGTLVKSASDGTVYLIRNGQKQGIASPTVLRNLYPNGGFDFKEVITIADDEFANYPVGSVISSQLPSNGRTHAEGRLIRRSTGGEVSIVTDNGTRRAFVSEAVFLGLGYLWCNVVDATDSNYDSYPVGPPVNGLPAGTPPSAPVATSASGITPSSFTANWNSSSGATGYRLDVCTNTACTAFVSGHDNLDVGNVTSKIVNGLSASTAYRYRIRAYNAAGTSANSNSIDVTTGSNQIQVNVQTSPSGRTFVVDGTNYSTPQSFSWTAGSSHTIGTNSPQAGATGTQYVWSSWSDGFQISHSVAPTTSTTYTASFNTQYFLTMNANPGGNTSPSSGWRNSGESVQIAATANTGQTFSGWTGSGSGSYTGTNNPATITMNGPINETASFVATIAHRAPFDFDGDGKTDIGIFRPTVAEWWINRSSNGSTLATQFGVSNDKIVPADFTGDGKADIGVWRPSDGGWYVLRSENFTYFGFTFGTNGDVPVPADFDADGRADAAVFRPSTNVWYAQLTAGGIAIQIFGASGDIPVPADYDGDGRADIAIFRPANGQWWLSRSSAGVAAFTFGNSGDKSVQGDYTGDGKADVAFWRPSSGQWFVLRSEDSSFYAVPFGLSTDIPAPGDYDGDGRHDPTVFRPSQATWYSQRSGSPTLIQQFGANGDRPIPNAFVP